MISKSQFIIFSALLASQGLMSAVGEVNDAALVADPAPQTGSGSPAPQTGSGSPALQAGSGSPASQAGSGSPAPQTGSGSPAPQPGSGSPVPQAGSGSPAHQASPQTESESTDKAASDNSKSPAVISLVEDLEGMIKKGEAKIDASGSMIIVASEAKIKMFTEGLKTVEGAAAFKKEEKEEITKSVPLMAKALFPNDAAKEKVAVETLTLFAIEMPERMIVVGKKFAKIAEEVVKKAKTKKAEAASKEAAKSRRLAGEDKEVRLEPLHQVILEIMVKLDHDFKTLYKKYTVSDLSSANFNQFKADVDTLNMTISEAEAVLKLKADTASTESELKKAKATALGLGLGLGLGIPALTAIVFTVLVKTNRLLLNFGGSTGASADV